MTSYQAAELILLVKKLLDKGNQMFIYEKTDLVAKFDLQQLLSFLSVSWKKRAASSKRAKRSLELESGSSAG